MKRRALFEAGAPPLVKGGLRIYQAVQGQTPSASRAARPQPLGAALSQSLPNHVS